MSIITLIQCKQLRGLGLVAWVVFGLSSCGGDASFTSLPISQREPAAEPSGEPSPVPKGFSLVVDVNSQGGSIGVGASSSFKVGKVGLGGVRDRKPAASPSYQVGGGIYFTR